MTTTSRFADPCVHAVAPRRPTNRAALPPRRLPAAEHVHAWRTCSAATPASSTRCAASSTTAAPFIGFAIVLDMLDGRVARMTGTHERVRRRVRFAGRRDLVRRRAGDPVVPVGPASARPHRMGGGFLFVAAAAVRLARFNIQSGTQDKRYFVGLPSPAAAAVPAADGVRVSRTGSRHRWRRSAVLAHGDRARHC